MQKMQNATEQAIIWLTNFPGVVSSLPESIIKSSMSTLIDLCLRTFNMLLQSILFSYSILQLISFVCLMMGLGQASSIAKNKYVVSAFGLLFAILHFTQFSDNHQYIHQFLKYATAVYTCIYVCYGAVYVKQKIDGHQKLSQLNSKQHEKQYQDQLRNQNLISQVFLILITLSSAGFFIFIWYHVKVQKSLPLLNGNYYVLVILILQTVLAYICSLVKRVSLFMPAIICCLMYLTLFIRILLSLYPSRQLQTLSLPLQSLPILFFSLHGKQKHISSQLSYLRGYYKNHDNQHMQQKLKVKRQLIDSLYYVAVCYYLYSVVHGCVVNMEYMIGVVYVIMLVLKVFK